MEEIILQMPKLETLIIFLGVGDAAFQILRAPTFLEHVKKSPDILSSQTASATPVFCFSKHILGVESCANKKIDPSLITAKNTSSPGLHTREIT